MAAAAARAARLRLAGKAAKDPDLFLLRVARKQHGCQTLRRDGGRVRSWDGGELPPEHGPIQPGEQYVEYLGETPAFQAGDRFCRACALAAGLVEEVAPCSAP